MNFRPAIRVNALHKFYGAVEAVRGVDLTVHRGEVFALLGPNGAGKTTIVEILEGHRARSGGAVEVLGYDPARHERAFKEGIGIVLQSTSVDRYLTAREAVALFGGYYPHPRPVDEVLALVGLADHGATKVRHLSGGQLRRLDVAIGLAGDPDLLFLDEPTTGFDPSARRQAWDLVRSLQALGKTVFLTTHYLDEAEQLADRVAIIAGGRIIAEGTPQALIGARPYATIRFHLPAGVEALPAALAPLAAHGDDGWLRIDAPDPTRMLFDLTRWATDAGVELPNLTVSRPSLEDVYLQLTRDLAPEPTP